MTNNRYPEIKQLIINVFQKCTHLQTLKECRQKFMVSVFTCFSSIKTVWRKLKKEWLNPEDYLYKDKLFYAVNRCMASLGHDLMINFSHFNAN